MQHDADTIAAIATAPGVGALAVVRISGPLAFELAASVARTFDRTRAREARLVTLRDRRGEPIDQAMVTSFPAPHSFTGEDIVEFSTHGGALVPASVLAALLEAGARQALPGEFTRRAVLNGRIDLLQAEAIGDLISAKSHMQLRNARGQLDGLLSRRLDDLRNQVFAVEAMLAYAIDFPEEDDGPIPSERVRTAIEDLRQQLVAVGAHASRGEALRNGATVVLAGPVNAGKSSLYNALLRRHRSIVSDEPGTTRDAIESDMELAGWQVRLVDTAGFREPAGRVEAAGISISSDYVENATLVLWCVANGGELAQPPATAAPTLRVATKLDLDGATPAGWIGVSSVTGEGIAALEAAIATHAGLIPVTTDEPWLTRTRHRIAVEHSTRALESAAAEWEAHEPVLAAQALRTAASGIGELIGGSDHDDVLATVFAGFCIGK